MLVVENNTTAVFWGMNNEVHPLEYAGDIVVVFDPSKTNMACLIGSPDGTILNILEFSGNNRKSGPVMDTTVYCNEVRAFLRAYLKNAHIYLAAVEQAILKKGASYYHSNMVLTEIRGNLLNFFMEEYQLQVIEINNWSWKHSVLPEGYRGQHQKGSKKWFLNTMPNSPYSKFYEADATDCICMFWYLIGNKCANYTTVCNRVEDCIVDYTYGIYPRTQQLNTIRNVPYNDRFSIEQNISFYANRLFKPFVLTVPTSKLDLHTIYEKSIMFTKDNIFDKEVKVVASRRCGS